MGIQPNILRDPNAIIDKTVFSVRTLSASEIMVHFKDGSYAHFWADVTPTGHVCINVNVREQEGQG
jgi:hypothetical protein